MTTRKKNLKKHYFSNFIKTGGKCELKNFPIFCHLPKSPKQKNYPQNKKLLKRQNNIFFFKSCQNLSGKIELYLIF